MVSARVLIVDDDSAIVEELAGALSAEGFDAVGSTAPAEVGTKARLGNFDVVLLDIHMGEYGAGKVLLDLSVSAPLSKVIVMSGEPNVERVLTCIQHGAVDFIAKPFDLGDLFQRIRVNMLRPRFPIDPGVLREHLIDSLWENVKLEHEARRGRRLEQLLYNLFSSIEFFRDIRTNVRSDAAEIDVEAINEGTSAFWRDSGSLIAAECKNWSPGARSAGVQELDHFAASMRRSSRYKVGFFISMTGFSQEFHFGRMKNSGDDRVIVPVNAKELKELVKSSNRSAVLEEWIRKYSR